VTYPFGQPANTRVQRTRPSASRHRAPLTRHTLGGVRDRRRRWIPASLLAIVVVACAASEPITAVTSHAGDLRLLKHLTQGEVAQFQVQWDAKREVDGSFNHGGEDLVVLDITRGGRSERWHYRTSGYLQVLAMNSTPVYKVQDVVAFNRLVGAAS
jgi:hypothetical protein